MKNDVIKSYLFFGNNDLDLEPLSKAFHLLLKRNLPLKKFDRYIEVGELNYDEFATISVSLPALQHDNNLDYLSFIIVPTYNDLFLKFVKTYKTGTFYVYEKLLESLKDDDNIPVIKEILKDIPEEILLTVKSYINCNNSLALTGSYLFAHRNTINYRINKFYSLTSINVRENQSALLLGLMLSLLQI